MYLPAYLRISYITYIHTHIHTYYIIGSACHTLYPKYVTNALQKALYTFDKQLPGFITPEAILHGVETRTSSPIQISRDSETLESVNVAGMFPAGEGAGEKKL